MPGEFQRICVRRWRRIEANRVLFLATNGRPSVSILCAVFFVRHQHQHCISFSAFIHALHCCVVGSMIICILLWSYKCIQVIVFAIQFQICPFEFPNIHSLGAYVVLTSSLRTAYWINIAHISIQISYVTYASICMFYYIFHCVLLLNRMAACLCVGVHIGPHRTSLVSCALMYNIIYALVCVLARSIAYPNTP